MTKDVRISQAMIVKNEEQNIARALSWGKDIMYEQIVVDTGSTDQTVEIACKLGAIVYQITWDNDFSKAKNYAIEKCSGDWIAFLDADEYFEKADLTKITTLIQRCDGANVDAINHMVFNVDGKGGMHSVQTQMRFFRNNKDIRYGRPIHEQLERENGSLAVYDATSELNLIHTGYVDEALNEKLASGRNRKLIRETAKTHPDDAVTMGYLADTFSEENDSQQAEIYYRKAIELYKNQHLDADQRLVFNYIGLIRSMHENTALENEIKRIYREAEFRFPKEPDIPYAMGTIYYYSGKFYDAAELFSIALKKLNDYGYVNQAVYLVGNLLTTYKQTADSFHRIKKDKEAFEYAYEVVQNAPEDMQGIELFLDIMRVLDDDSVITTDATLHYLSKVYDLNDLKSCLLTLKAANEMRYFKLAGIIKNTLSKEEIDILEEKGFI